MDIFEENYLTLIELKIQEYIEEVYQADDQLEILYIQVLIGNHWEPYFFGLNTLD
jgi:hypothetical protein